MDRRVVRAAMTLGCVALAHVGAAYGQGREAALRGPCAEPAGVPVFQNNRSSFCQNKFAPEYQAYWQARQAASYYHATGRQQSLAGYPTAQGRSGDAGKDWVFRNSSGGQTVVLGAGRASDAGSARAAGSAFTAVPPETVVPIPTRTIDGRERQLPYSERSLSQAREAVAERLFCRQRVTAESLAASEAAGNGVVDWTPVGHAAPARSAVARKTSPAKAPVHHDDEIADGWRKAGDAPVEHLGSRETESKRR